MSRRASVALVAAGCVVAAVITASPVHARDDILGGRGIEVGGGGDDEYRIDAWSAEYEYRLSQRLRPEQREFDYVRTPECKWPGGSDAPCPQIYPGLPPLSLACEDGAPIAPLWRTRVDNPGAGWHLRADWACPEDLLPPFTAEDLRALKIAPLKVNHQPADGPMLISKPVIVFAEPDDREFHVVLFGMWGVDVVVSPQEYTWEFGDGQTLTTTEPGRPYPAFDLTHEYDEVGTAQIALTTTWSAKYRVDTDPRQRWRDANGIAVTVDRGVEFEVIELRSKLVD
ncbi:MAG: PKD domain-containing protein [Cellulomonas sp.]|nr:hypothetical protein [Cellulomonas sp.]MCR6648876.1 PKD domain-containing protein [Cellulomonas sp.]